MKPTVVCPNCHARIALSSVSDQPSCTSCGPFTPTDTDFRWRAFGRATETLLAPRTRSASPPALALWMIDGIPAIELSTRSVDAGDLGPALGVSAAAAIGAAVPLLLEAARLDAVGGLVALKVAPDAARKLAEGTARWMTSDGASLATVVDLKGKAIAQARWAPAAVAAFGVAAAWQVLSVAVAQKHLHDINARLDRIERRVDEILRELEQQVQDELRGDATALGLIARAVTAHPPDEETRRDHKVNVRHHLDRTRTRHEGFLRRAREQCEPRPYETARLFGQSLETAGTKLTARAREFHQRLMAVYGNILVETVALRLLVALGEDPRFVEAALQRARHNVDDADALARRFDTDIAWALPAMAGIFTGATTNAKVRSRVAFAHWQAVEHQLSAVAPLRTMLEEFDAPQLCAVLDGAREVTEVRMLLSQATVA